MRWVGHLARMEGGRLPKQLFYGELQLENTTQETL